MIQVLSGHNELTMGMAFSTDGKRFEDKDCCDWSGISYLPGYLSEGIGVAFSPLDGVASAGTCIPLANRRPVGPGPNPRDTLTFNG